MRIRGTVAGIVVVAVSSWTAVAGATPPCFQPTDLSPEVLLPPPNATDVPRNARILVHNVDPDVLSVVDQDGANIPFTREGFSLHTGFYAKPIFRLVPNVLLPANGRVSVRGGDRELAALFTGDTLDELRPTTPAPTFVGPYTDGACPPYVEIAVEVPDEPVLFLARLEAEPGPDVNVDGFALDERLVVSGPANAEAEVLVRAVDAAGNFSASSSVNVVFPDEYKFPLGCTSTSTSTADAAVLVLVLARITARRRASPRR